MSHYQRRRPTNRRRFPLNRSPVAFDRYNLEDVEREVIARVLRKHQGNVSQTARTRLDPHGPLPPHGEVRPLMAFCIANSS